MTWLPVFLGLLGMSLVGYGAGILWMAHYVLDPASPRTGPTPDAVAPSGTAREDPAPRRADIADNYPRWSESAVLPGH